MTVLAKAIDRNAEFVTLRYVYTKLFQKILDSSIWLESPTTRVVWITLLAAMDEDGYAHFSAIENLAARARVSTDEAEAAIQCFLAPDPNSANPANDGRRVERVPGGFVILNAEAHRAIINRVMEREQTRLRVARHRAKHKGDVTPVTPLQDVTSVSASASSSEGDARGMDGFETFWGMYPNRKARRAAERAWNALKPDDELARKIVDAVAQQHAERARLKSAGKFVPAWPYPATWINGRRWEDETSGNARPRMHDEEIAARLRQGLPTGCFLGGDLHIRFNDVGFDALTADEKRATIDRCRAVLEKA